MKYFRDTMHFSIPEPSAVSLGKFDGLHEGHKYLLREIKNGEESGLRSVAFTFDVPPRALTQEDFKVLLTNPEKERIFASVGLDYVIECPFTEELKSMEPREFLRFLTGQVHVKLIAAGTDFRFGRDRSGSCLDLQKYEAEFGYRARIVDKEQYKGEDISSTRIRERIQAGDMEEANRMLGYPYFLMTPVEHGTRTGSSMGIPTVNQSPPEQKLLPPNGVYASAVTVDGRSWQGISNIGNKPTAGEAFPLGVETHIFDFDGQIYGKNIQVAFLSYLRPERKFDSMEDLYRQIRSDCRKAREICADNALQRI